MADFSICFELKPICTTTFKTQLHIMSKVPIEIYRSATLGNHCAALNKKTNKNVPKTVHTCQANIYLEPCYCSHYGAEF